MDKMNEIMDRIEELLEDKNETVTYMMLSEEFKITTVEAREIMGKYVRKRKERDPDSIGLLYVVYGITKAEGHNYVAVVSPTAMEEQTEKLNDCHTMLLSVYKAKSNDGGIQPDPFGMFRANKAPLSGCVVSCNAVKRKLKSRTTAPQASAKTEVEVKKPVAKVESSSSANNGKKKQNGLGNFLSKATNKPEFEKKPPPKPNTKNVMASFFSKATPTVDKKQHNSTGDGDEKIVSKIIEDVEMKTEEHGERANDKKHKLIDTDDSEDDHAPAKKSNATQPQSQKKKKRPRNEKKKIEQPSKKRRRIINDDENSDSDDIFGSDNDGGKDDGDVIDVSDTEEVKVAAKNTRKVRKKVSDMFLEEDGGYFQTVNKWEYESASDKEEEKEQKPDNVIQAKTVGEAGAKKSETPKVKSIVSPPKATKKGKPQKATPQNQTSIMSFFKKK